MFYNGKTVNHYVRNNSWKPECALSFNMGWQDISKFYPSLPLRIKYSHVKTQNTFWLP
jgi:hypothetical protein